MQNDKFDAIPIPEELNHAVRDGIKEGLRQRKTLHRKRTFSGYGAVAGKRDRKSTRLNSSHA